MKYFSATFVFLILFIGNSAKSCSICACPCDQIVFGGPIIATPGFTPKQGQLVLGTSWVYQGADSISQTAMQNYARRHIHVHNHGAMNSLALNALYGITDDLSIGISYPYIFRSNIQSTHDTVSNDGDSIGFGDMTLSARYRFYEANDWHAALIAGLKLPTGQTNERAPDGDKLGIDHQPGTGSLDPLMGLALTKVAAPFTYTASAIYRLSTRGSQDTAVGDTVLYNLAATYSIDPESDHLLDRAFPEEILGHSSRFALVLEMNGVFQEQLEYQGLKEEGHGGNTIFLSPGLSAAFDDTVYANLSLGFPVIDELSGIQAGSGIRLFFSLNYLL